MNKYSTLYVLAREKNELTVAAKEYRSSTFILLSEFWIECYCSGNILPSPQYLNRKNMQKFHKIEGARRIVSPPPSKPSDHLLKLHYISWCLHCRFSLQGACTDWSTGWSTIVSLPVSMKIIYNLLISSVTWSLGFLWEILLKKKN